MNGQACTAACSCEPLVEDFDENQCANPFTIEALKQMEQTVVDSDGEWKAWCMKINNSAIVITNCEGVFFTCELLYDM